MKIDIKSISKEDFFEMFQLATFNKRASMTGVYNFLTFIDEVWYGETVEENPVPCIYWQYKNSGLQFCILENGDIIYKNSIDYQHISKIGKIYDILLKYRIDEKI